MPMRALYLIFICLFLPSSAMAATLGEVRTALYEGQFDTAHEQAKALGTPEGLILAAEALNAKLLLGEAEKPKKTAKASMRLAQQALELDAQSVDAQMQYAVAYGFYGRHVSPFKAWRKKIPLKILSEIEKTAALHADMSDQNLGRNLALQGAWHFSVVERAGAGRAQKYYGANEIEGQRYFELALEHQPNDILISANYTLMRYVLAPETHQTWAQNNLRTLLKIAPQNAVEARVQEHMQIILDAFSTQKHNQENEQTNAQKLAQDFLS